MRRLAAAAAATCLLAGCASVPVAEPPGGRSAVIRRALASTVQLRSEREGGGRRAGSGVVVGEGAAPGDPALVLTARHFLDPPVRQQITVVVPGTGRRLRGEIRALSEESDLALVAVRGLALPAVTLQDTARLGDEVWVVGFPWGRRLTVVGGVVSQIAAEADDVPLEGPPRMVDASVSYGTSGGGVFDARTGAMIGIVEGYRTARVAVDTRPERTVDIPVPGETTLVPVGAITRFLRAAGY